MPYLSLEEEIAFLRDKAATLRRLAIDHPTAISSQLRGMTADLEARAAALEIRLKMFRAGDPQQSGLPSPG